MDSKSYGNGCSDEKKKRRWILLRYDLDSFIPPQLLLASPEWPRDGYLDWKTAPVA